MESRSATTMKQAGRGGIDEEEERRMQSKIRQEYLRFRQQQQQSGFLEGPNQMFGAPKKSNLSDGYGKYDEYYGGKSPRTGGDAFYNEIWRELERTRQDLNEAVNEVTYCEERSQKQFEQIRLLKKGLHLHNERAIKCLLHIHDQYHHYNEEMWSALQEQEVDTTSSSESESERDKTESEATTERKDTNVHKKKGNKGKLDAKIEEGLKGLQKSIKVAFKSMQRYNEQISKMMEVGGIQNVYLDSQKLIEKVSHSSSSRLGKSQPTKHPHSDSNVSSMSEQQDVPKQPPKITTVETNLSAKYEALEKEHQALVKEYEQSKTSHEKRIQELRGSWERSTEALTAELKSEWVKERQRADTVEQNNKVLQQEVSVLENALDRLIDMPQEELQEAVSSAKDRANQAGQELRKELNEKHTKELHKDKEQWDRRISKAVSDPTHNTGDIFDQVFLEAIPRTERESPDADGLSNVLNEVLQLSKTLHDEQRRMLTVLDDCSSTQTHDYARVLENLHGSVEQMNTTNEKLQMRIKFLRDTKPVVTDGHASSAGADEGSESLHRQLCDAKKSNKQQKFRIDELEMQVSSFEEELEKQSSKKNRLTRALEKAVSSLEETNEQLRIMATDEAALRRRFDSTKERLRTAEDRSEQLESEVRRYQRELQELLGKIAETESVHLRTVDEYKRTISRLEAELTNATEERDQYWYEGQQAADDLRAVLDQAEDTADERDHLDSRLQRISEELDALRAERENSFAYSSSAEAERLNAQNQDLENALNEMRAELQNCKARAAQAESKITEMEKELESLKKHNGILEDQIRKYEQEVREQGEKLAKESRAKAEALERAEKLDQRISEENERRLQAEEEMSPLAHRIETMESRLSEINSRLEKILSGSCTSWSEGVHSFSGDNEQLAQSVLTKLSSLQTEIENLRNNRGNIASTVSSSRSSSPDSFRGQLSPEAGRDTEQLRGDIDEAYGAVRSLESRLQQAQKESSTLQQKLSSRSLASRSDTVTTVTTTTQE